MRGINFAMEHAMTDHYPFADISIDLNRNADPRFSTPPSVTSILSIASGIHSEAEIERLVADVPTPTGWCGKRDRPWGLGDRYKSGDTDSIDLDAVKLGKDSYFFRLVSNQYFERNRHHRSYDTLREAFVSERLNPALGRRTYVSAHGFGVASTDIGVQLDFLRMVMKHILRTMPVLDLASISHQAFAGQRHLCEHYLWWLEMQGFVAHPRGQERQDRLMLSAEGCAVLAMLEMTVPNSNHDLSPKAIYHLRRSIWAPSGRF